MMNNTTSFKIICPNKYSNFSNKDIDDKQIIFMTKYKNYYEPIIFFNKKIHQFCLNKKT